MWHYRSQWSLFSTQTIYMLSSVFVSVCVILREPHEDKRWPHTFMYVSTGVRQKDIRLQCCHRYVHKINAETQTSTRKASTNRGQMFSSSKRINHTDQASWELLSLQGRELTSSIPTTCNSYFQYSIPWVVVHYSSPVHHIIYYLYSTINQSIAVL